PCSARRSAFAFFLAWPWLSEAPASFVIVLVLVIVLGLPWSFRSRAGARARLRKERSSVIKQRHAGVPDREHHEQKRKRRVDEQPAVEPVVQAHLHIQHAASIAPVLD